MNGPGGQAEQVLEQRQHRRAGGAHAGVDDVDHDRRHRADGAGHQEAAERDQRELRVWPTSAMPSRGAPKARHQHQQRGDAQQRHRRAACGAAGARRRGRPPRPRPRCRRRRTAPPAPPCTAAWSGAMPCTRLRKLGSHDQTADTTISCAAPPMQTHSMVRERDQRPTMCRGRLAERARVARPARGVELHRAVVAHLQVQQRQQQAGNADDAEGGLPAPARRDHAAEHHAEHRADRGRRRRSRPAARRACAPGSGWRSAPRRPSRSRPRPGRPPRARRAAGRSCA